MGSNRKTDSAHETGRMMDLSIGYLIEWRMRMSRASSLVSPGNCLKRLDSMQSHEPIRANLDNVVSFVAYIERTSAVHSWKLALKTNWEKTMLTDRR